MAETIICIPFYQNTLKKCLTTVATEHHRQPQLPSTFAEGLEGTAAGVVLEAWTLERRPTRNVELLRCYRTALTL